MPSLVARELDKCVSDDLCRAGDKGEETKNCADLNHVFHLNEIVPVTTCTTYLKKNKNWTSCFQNFIIPVTLLLYTKI